ncbi:MAG: copper amine oxidase, partial [Nitrososphaera sp.]
KDTKDNGSGGVYPTGVKVTLFDVSDVSNPKLVDDYVIGGQGTDSEALYDHKAFLFDKGRNLLSIPVSTYDSEPKPGPESNGMYVQPRTWRGFYVFTVSPEAGVSLKGTIEHSNSTANSQDYYYQYGVQGSRSFFIDGVLYTVSLNHLIKMNDIETLQELNRLEMGSTGGIIKYPEPLDRAQPQAGGQQQ